MKILLVQILTFKHFPFFVWKSFVFFWAQILIFMLHGNNILLLIIQIDAANFVNQTF